MEMGDVLEQLDALETDRLEKLASRYYVLPPEKPRDREDREDENWGYGWISGTWHLKPPGVASIRRRVEEAQKRRLELWEARAKIAGTVITGLIALGSVLVSLILAWRK